LILYYNLIFDKIMKKIFLALAALVGLVVADDTCTEPMQIACVDDFRAAYPICQKAAQAGGSDMAADLACMKYYNKMKGECWPCICFIAHQ
jgi:hypothetical protein